MVGSKASSSFCSRRNVCRCGEDVLLMTSNTESNPGKKFWRCRNWKRKSCCGYFAWADEETVEGGRNEDSVEGFTVEIMELKMKLAKVQRKLSNERKSRKWFIAVLGFSWAMTIILCVFFAVKCVGCK
ncbi:Zinc finger, GRF-type [Sesbania bispinosa]|nr:Zinc finger, GRF-type [Sesbania bispinosa]